jgi:modification methylase
VRIVENRITCYNRSIAISIVEVANLASLFASDEGCPRLAPNTQNQDRLSEDEETRDQLLLGKSRHTLHRGDAKDLSWIADRSVHLVVTSPPYWNLKKYNDGAGQMGDVSDYNEFFNQLDHVWEHCYRVLPEGGRIACVVGDVCLARRRNNGRHQVVPLHADIAVRARRIGFDYLTPILWHKVTNATLEVNNGSSFLGKPYEPNAIIKNDVEYILMLRKSGGYRTPTLEQRRLSKISKEDYSKWFRPFWSDVSGASTRNHPAPYSVSIAYRLVRMFSFVGDTVLDPFLGSGTTVIAAMQAGRNSIGNELDPHTSQMQNDVSEKRYPNNCSSRRDLRFQY